jgi:hypothetical protein
LATGVKELNATDTVIHPAGGHHPLHVSYGLVADRRDRVDQLPPKLGSEYSTRGGISGQISRFTRPSRSSARRVCVKTLGLIPRTSERS